MKPWMRMVVLVLTVLLCTASALAYELPSNFSGQSLEDIMAAFMQDRGLNENNYSISYYNTATGESYAFNDDKFMVAASTYKLPLNMYYYELEQEGTIASDAYISRAGMTLDKIHYESLVNSNNDVSIGLLYNLGEFRDYKNCMRKYFTMTDQEIDYLYYVDNYYCTRMMMDALRYLYEYRADFSEMIGYMKQAQPDEYFAAGVTDYEVAHKYGWFEGAVNDVGIIYTDQPFLLAVYTQDTDASVVADTAALLTAYHVWKNQPEPEPEENTQLELEVQYVPKENPELQPPEEERPATDPVAAVPEPQETPSVSAFEWWMVAVAAGVFLLGGGSLLLLNPGKLKKKYEKKYADRFETDHQSPDDAKGD